MKLHSCYEDGTAVASSRRDNKRGLFLEGRQMILACKKGQNQEICRRREKEGAGSESNSIHNPI